MNIYNDIDDYACEWLLNLIQAGESPIECIRVLIFCGYCTAIAKPETEDLLNCRWLSVTAWRFNQKCAIEAPDWLELYKGGK